MVSQLADKLALSAVQQGAAFAGIALAVWLWLTLTDDDVAYRDRTSRKLIARLRRWLRKVLRVRVV